VIKMNTELVPAIQVHTGDTIKLSTGKGWTRKNYKVDSVIKMAHIWETEKLHGVCMRFSSGETASMADETMVKVLDA